MEKYPTQSASYSFEREINFYLGSISLGIYIEISTILY